MPEWIQQLLGPLGLTAASLVVVYILWNWGNKANNLRIANLESTVKVLEAKLEKCEQAHDTQRKSHEESLIRQGIMQGHIDILERLANIPKTGVVETTTTKEIKTI